MHRLFESCRTSSTPEPQLHYEPGELWIEFPFSREYTKAISHEGDSSVDAEDVDGTSVKTSVKTSVMILRLLGENPEMTLLEVASRLGRTVRAIELASSKLVKQGRLRHVGPQWGGRWEVLE